MLTTPLTCNHLLGTPMCPQAYADLARYDLTWRQRSEQLVNHPFMRDQVAVVVRLMCTADPSLDARDPCLRQLVIEVMVVMIIAQSEMITVQATPQRERGWFQARGGIFDTKHNIYVPPLITGSIAGPLLGFNSKYKSTDDTIRDMIWPEFSKCESSTREAILQEFVDRCSSVVLPKRNVETVVVDSRWSHLVLDHTTLNRRDIVFEEMREKYKLGEQRGTEATDRGTASEPLVMALVSCALQQAYGPEFEVGMTQTGLTISVERPWTAASPDGLIFVKHRASGEVWLRGLEMKVRGILGPKPIGPIPDYYWAQVQSALQIFKFEYNYDMRDYLFVSYTPDEMHMTSFEYDADVWARVHQSTLDRVYFERVLPLFILKILNRLEVGSIRTKRSFGAVVDSTLDATVVEHSPLQPVEAQAPSSSQPLQHFGIADWIRGLTAKLEGPL